MSNETEKEVVEGGGWGNSCLMWFFWGGSMSFMAVFSLVLLALLIASVTLNVYLGWQLAGLEVAISRRGVAPLELPAPLATDILAAIPTQTPAATPTALATSAPQTTNRESDSLPAESPLEAQFATLSALATDVAALRSESLPSSPETPPPTVAVPAAVGPPPDVPQAVAINPSGAQDTSSSPAAEAEVSSAPPVDDASAPPPAENGSTVVDTAVQAPAPTVPYSALTSSNSYSLIPINGERDQRPAEEHGDLNLKLREPQSIEAEVGLVDAGSGVDANAPRLSKVFEPEFTATYGVHNWDWACNCKGELIQDDQAILVGIKTTPDEPIFIPPTESDIYDGKYYAVVLYASEDSLTVLYAREGTVAMGYTIHYMGLRTDPNLLKLYQESKGSELPGLTLDTPVGIATDELIVAVRDNGTFLDARSINDWWD